MVKKSVRVFMGACTLVCVCLCVCARACVHVHYTSTEGYALAKTTILVVAC